MSKHSYDVIVIGGGSAGLSAVESARSLGASVCLIEKGKLGGSDVHEISIPKKALLRSAAFYRSLQEAKRFGVTLGATAFQFADVMRYRDQTVDALITNNTGSNRFEKRLKELEVDVRIGVAKFEDDHLISVSGEQIYGKAIVITTGCTETVPDIKGLDAIHYLRAKDVFAKARQPKALVIIGGGELACEMALFYASFGTRIVLLEQSSRILMEEDEECVRMIEASLQRLGVDIVTNAMITEIVDGRGGVYGVKVDVHGIQSMHAVEQIVLASKSSAYTSGLGIDTIGVSCNSQGSISVSKEQKTSVAHIFAAGGVSESSLLQRAQEEGSIAGFNAALCALNKKTAKQTGQTSVLPHVISLDPEFASIGCTAADVKKRFGQVLVGRCNTSKLDRSITEHETVGFVKLVAHPKTRKLLGAQILGTCAGELIQEIALAMSLNSVVDKLAVVSYASLTRAEGIRNAAMDLILES